MTKYFYSQEKQFRLITISISHYCEKVRWVLERLELPYVEEPHMPPFHRLATGRVGGKSVPVLITNEGIFKDSTDILQYLDAIAPVDAKLYPTDSNLRQQAEELEDLFDSELGPATRRWGFFYALNDQRLMQSLWCRGVPPVERALFPVVFPWMRSTARRSMNITAESAANAHEQIKSIFEKVGELLADGRSYLVGDCLCAADITFAALAAPAVTLPEPRRKSPGTQALLAKRVSEIRALRKTTAGAYALRLYSERNNDNNKRRQ